MWKILESKGDQVEGEVDGIERRVTYHSSQVEVVTYLTPPA